MKDRINKIKSQLNSDSAFLVLSELHSFYLSNFKFTDGALLVTEKEAYLLVDSRYSEAAEINVKHCKVMRFDRLFDTITELLKKENIKKIFFERENMALKQADLYKDKLSKEGFEAIFDDTLDNLLLELRNVKTADELSNIKKAQEITEEAFLHALPKIHDGMTERELALEIEFEMKRHGAESVSFDLITISGKKTSMPHGEPDDSVIRNGDFITMDIGAVYKGYHSDMTRTVALGFASEKMCDIYNIVLRAQLTALNMIKAGVSSKDIDKAARDVISDAGYGEYFRHSTGHGVGIQIHEQPGVSPNCDIILKSGMVITVEPGIYLPGEFGVRIEDMVQVTDDGYVNFAKLPKELLVLHPIDKN